MIESASVISSVTIDVEVLTGNNPEYRDGYGVRRVSVTMPDVFEGSGEDELTRKKFFDELKPYAQRFAMERTSSAVSTLEHFSEGSDRVLYMRRATGLTRGVVAEGVSMPEAHLAAYEAGLLGKRGLILQDTIVDFLHQRAARLQNV